jgi:hypothetical protein
MLAYDFPLMGLFWSMMMLFFFVVVAFAVIWTFIDNFRRSDHGGWAKAAWALVIVVFPLLGTFVYIVARPVIIEGRVVG